MGLEKVYALFDRMAKCLGANSPDPYQEGSGELWLSFCEAMEDDFNTARAMGIVFDTVRRLNRVMDDTEGAGGEHDRVRLQSAWADLKRIGGVLGIGTEVPAHFFKLKKAKAMEREAIDEALVERLIAERLQARQQKDWARADQIRDQLAAMNIVLEDRPEGTVWKAK